MTTCAAGFELTPNVGQPVGLAQTELIQTTVDAPELTGLPPALHQNEAPVRFDWKPSPPSRWRRIAAAISSVVALGVGGISETRERPTAVHQQTFASTTPTFTQKPHHFGLNLPPEEAIKIEPTTGINAPKQLNAVQQAVIESKRQLSPAKKKFIGDMALAIEAVVAEAKVANKQICFNGVVMLGQAALESGWGQSTLVTEDNNPFGMKYWGEEGDTSTGDIDTSEDDSNGKSHASTAPFLHLGSLEEAVWRYNRDMCELPHYDDVKPFGDKPWHSRAESLLTARRYINALQTPWSMAYASVVGYEDKLMDIIVDFELDRLRRPYIEPRPHWLRLPDAV